VPKKKEAHVTGRRCFLTGRVAVVMFFGGGWDSGGEAGPCGVKAQEIRAKRAGKSNIASHIHGP